MKTIYLAGGCFWGMQKFFDQFDGVIRTEVGYANGPDFAPSYRDVCDSSGHAETLWIEYDEAAITLDADVRHRVARRNGYDHRQASRGERGTRKADNQKARRRL